MLNTTLLGLCETFASVADTLISFVATKSLCSTTCNFDKAFQDYLQGLTSTVFCKQLFFTIIILELYFVCEPVQVVIGNALEERESFEYRGDRALVVALLKVRLD